MHNYLEFYKVVDVYGHSGGDGLIGGNAGENTHCAVNVTCCAIERVGSGSAKNIVEQYRVAAAVTTYAIFERNFVGCLEHGEYLDGAGAGCCGGEGAAV